MNNIIKYNETIFENIKHVDEYGIEFWYARELQKVLEYKDWRNFKKVIDKAVISANNSISNEKNWVVEVNKPIKTGKGKEEIIRDYKLSRYMCYLIAQNVDPSKDVVALGQTYFAIQTRKQESELRDYVREILLIYWNISMAYNIYDPQNIKELINSTKITNLDIQVQLFIKYMRTPFEKYSELYNQIRSQFLNKNYSVLSNKNIM